MAAEHTFFYNLPARRMWFQGSGLLLTAWSIVAAGTLAISIGILFLILDLMTYRGRIEVGAANQDQLAPYVTTISRKGIADDTGIRATLWRHRGCPVVDAVRTPLSRFIPLRTNRGALASYVVALIVVVVLRAWSLNRMRFRAAALAQDTTTSLRSQIHRQILRLGPGDLDQRDYVSAQQLFVQSAESVATSLTALLSTGVYQVAGMTLVLGLMLVVDWSMTLQALLPLLACFYFVRWESSQGAERQLLAEAHAAADLRILSEGLRKSRIVRGYGMEAFEQERFLKHLARYSGTAREGALARGGNLWAARVTGALLLAVVIYLIGSRVLGTGKPLDLPAALTILTGFAAMTPLLHGLMGWGAIRESLQIEGANVHRFLSILPEVGQAVGAKFIDPVSQSIQFEAVTYRRGDQTLLRDFELRLPAGSVTAFVSLDPLEARAAAAMLPRFLEPQTGRVLFDGEDIAWGTLESIRAEAIYVGGDDPCFTGTVLENIRCGDSRYDSTAVMEAAKTVHAHQFIQRLSSGYETQLGEHGEQLTIGQMFLLGLARAHIRNPAVLIIDEPTESLDQATKDYLDDTYQRIIAQRTVIFVPSRLSTVRRCDRVVVIEGGKVEAVGPQAELVKSCELYRHWEYVTFNAFRRSGEKG